MRMRSVTAILFLTLLTACGRAEEARRASMELEMQALEAERILRAKELETAKLEKVELGSIEPLHRLGDIWLGGQPSEGDLTVLQASGVRTVINLRHTAEFEDFDEPALIAELGMKYVRLPWAKPEELTDDILKRARQHLKGAERPIFLHCSSGNRTGAVWMAWRALDAGLSPGDAALEGRTVGMREPAYEAKVLDYVQRESAEQ